MPHVSQTEILQAPAIERLPEHVPAIWSTFQLVGSVVVSMLSVLAVGLPFNVMPAICLLVCGADWLVGGSRVSYALRSRDQVYHATATVVVAAIPILIVLVGIGNVGILQSVALLPLLWILLCPLHVGLHVMRFGTTLLDGGLDSVSPRGKRRASSPGFRGLKRAFDATLATIAGLCLCPILLVIATAIAFESEGPVLYAQERVGRDRHRFTMYKFRTMRPGSGSEWAKLGDGRITRLGAFLRRTSLDELPQLFNVLKGEMSLVGPRPEMPEYAHEFRSKIPRYDDRTLVDPGITGWAQVQLPRNLQPSDMTHVVPYDLFYVERSSRALDLYVLVKTVAEVVFHHAV